MFDRKSLSVVHPQWELQHGKGHIEFSVMREALEVLVLLLFSEFSLVVSLNCHDIVKDTEISYIDWHNLRQCLVEVNRESLPSNTSENIWRLTKVSFDGIDNIPLDAFKHLGNTLTVIPLDELKNLSMIRVEIVEAFGAVRLNDQGFSAKQKALIAQKVRTEWLGKGPETYSEYDLILLGEILCQLNTSDIEALHPDAFKNAVEWIGNIKNCPQDRLQALAKLAKHEDAFGEPRKWSKLDVSLVGNILNGLPKSDISLIDRDKLHLNRFYAARREKKNGERDRVDKISEKLNDTSGP